MLCRHVSGLCVLAALTFVPLGGAQAAPLSYLRPAVDAAAVSDGLVIKTVTAVGMAHRSARRTARRVHRRHGYHHY
ncbi:hypothetical protein [Methylobacterium sp. PvR107]|uniref:hypothetical protein n=1 Tax=Methylobacterium sp. PvR107 TaxID=2806597 RepID=UPI001AE93F8B|nr:hypothetical protein [Methylobacterium sp. PvR107]MBP1179241.1 hypothetical protein [Methylobacterium sp. PvR107]